MSKCLDLIQIYSGLYIAGKINKFLGRRWFTFKIFPLKIAWLARTAKKTGGNFMLV